MLDRGVGGKKRGVFSGPNVLYTGPNVNLPNNVKGTGKTQHIPSLTSILPGFWTHLPVSVFQTNVTSVNSSILIALCFGQQVVLKYLAERSPATGLTVLSLTHYFKLLNSEQMVMAFSECLCYTCTLNSRCANSKS